MNRATSPTRRRLLHYPLALPALGTWLTACSDGGHPTVRTLHTSSGKTVAAEARDDAALALNPDANPSVREEQDYRHRLYTPTFITKIGQRHFIVDCWHHRILHHHDLQQPIQDWHVLDEDLAGPHSIASNGRLYVAEDTGRHRLKVYREQGDGQFTIVQILDDVGRRPHRICHDPVRERFLVVGANDQSLHLYTPSGDTLKLEHRMTIPELQGEYCRSITLEGNRVYFVAATHIVIHEWHGDTLQFSGERVTLQPTESGDHGSCNDLFFLEDGRGILTSTHQKAYCFNRFDDLTTGKALEISSLFHGTPYYVSAFDGRLWIPDNTESSNINSFRPPARNEALENWMESADLNRLFAFGAPTAADLRRKAVLPT